MKKKTLTIIRNSWVSVKTKCKEFISLARDRIKRWFSNAHDFKLIVMDMLLKCVWLHKREVLFSLRMSICCYLDLLFPKKFSSCWFLCCCSWFNAFFFIHANVLVPTETQAQTQLKFQTSPRFEFNQSTYRRIQYVTMWRHGIVHKHTPRTSELQFALAFTVYTWFTSLELKRNCLWNGL